MVARGPGNWWERVKETSLPVRPEAVVAPRRTLVDHDRRPLPERFLPVPPATAPRFGSVGKSGWPESLERQTTTTELLVEQFPPLTCGFRDDRRPPQKLHYRSGSLCLAESHRRLCDKAPSHLGDVTNSWLGSIVRPSWSGESG